MDSKIFTVLHTLLTEKKYKQHLQQAMCLSTQEGLVSPTIFTSLTNSDKIKRTPRRYLYNLLQAFYRTAPCSSKEQFNPTHFFTKEELRGFEVINKNSFSDGFIVEQSTECNSGEYFGRVNYLVAKRVVRRYYKSDHFISLNPCSEESVNQSISILSRGWYDFDPIRINIEPDNPIELSGKTIKIQYNSNWNIAMSDSLARAWNHPRDSAVLSDSLYEYVPVKITRITREDFINRMALINTLYLPEMKDNVSMNDINKDITQLMIMHPEALPIWNDAFVQRKTFRLKNQLKFIKSYSARIIKYFLRTNESEERIADRFVSMMNFLYEYKYDELVEDTEENDYKTRFASMYYFWLFCKLFDEIDWVDSLANGIDGLKGYKVPEDLDARNLKEANKYFMEVRTCRMYNDDRKRTFIETIENELERENTIRLFDDFEMIETTLKKDICNFSRDEIISFTQSLAHAPSGMSAASKTKSLLHNYWKWCNENNYVFDKQDPYDTIAHRDLLSVVDACSKYVLSAEDLYKRLKEIAPISNAMGDWNWIFVSLMLIYDGVPVSEVGVVKMDSIKGNILTLRNNKIELSPETLRAIGEVHELNYFTKGFKYNKIVVINDRSYVLPRYLKCYPYDERRLRDKMCVMKREWMQDIPEWFSCYAVQISGQYRRAYEGKESIDKYADMHQYEVWVEYHDSALLSK